jgi:hypothetical protein
VVGAGDIDPIAALALGGGDLGGLEGPGVLDSGAVVAQDLGDADPVQGDARRES